jgi:hypothetical protein
VPYSGFCNIGAEAIHIIIVSLLGFGSGRSFSMWSPTSWGFLSSSSVFQLGSGSGRKIFKFPNIAKPYRCLQFEIDTPKFPNKKYK